MGLTATMESASAVEAAITVEPSAMLATVELTTTMKSFSAVKALVPAESLSAVPSAVSTEFAAVTESVVIFTKFAPVTESIAVSIPAAPIVAAPSAIVPSAVVATEPRTSAYEHISVKIIRTIVAIRSTRVGRVPVISVGAYRRRPNVDGRDSNPNSNPNLRMRCPRHNHEQPEQDDVF